MTQQSIEKTKPGFFSLASSLPLYPFSLSDPASYAQERFRACSEVTNAKERKPALSEKHIEQTNKTMAEAYNTRGAQRRALAALSSTSTPSKPLTLNDVPNDVLVSIFVATNDPNWVRHTVPCVCKAWNELFCSKDASPLHETLEVDFEIEERVAREGGSRLVAHHLTSSSAQEPALRTPIVNGWKVVSWAERRADSVRKLRVKGKIGEALARLVAIVGLSLTVIRIDSGLDAPFAFPFWVALGKFVFSAGRLRSLVVTGVDCTITSYCFFKIVQLAGSLEELVLETEYTTAPDSVDRGRFGLTRFFASFFSLEELRRLALVGHPQITSIPAGISSLQKLEDLGVAFCSLSSLPKELGELSRLTKLNLAGNSELGDTSQNEAFPEELKGMTSLQELDLSGCGPAFVGALESLEVLELSGNDLLIDAPLDFLIWGCPRLRKVTLIKEEGAEPWSAEELVHLEDFERTLLVQNRDAQVSYH